MPRQKDSDEGAAWIAIVMIAVVLIANCSSCAEPPPPRHDPDPAIVLAEMEADAAAALPAYEGPIDPEPEPDPAPIPTVDVSDLAPPPYRDPRWIRRCRVEARRNAPAAETIEVKDDARARARALARADELDEVLLLARIAYGETGTPRRANDDPRTSVWDEPHAFLAVIDRRRGAMSRAEMFAAYSPRRIFPHPDDQRQRWVAELQLDGLRPPSWPAWRGARWHHYPPWRQYGCPRWLATVDAIQRLMRSVPANVGAGPCTETPDHWGGGPGVDDQAERRGWRLVDCGRTRNRFWVVPTAAEE
jgi:hypothetical protein